MGRQAADREPGGDRGAQGGVALRRGVLQRAAGDVVLQRGVEGGAQRGGAEQLGGGEAAGEGDDAGALRQGEDLAYR